MGTDTSETNTGKAVQSRQVMAGTKLRRVRKLKTR